jgi:hypothetical protein
VLVGSWPAFDFNDEPSVVPNTYWGADPPGGVTLPPGTYTILSSSGTWSTDPSCIGGLGMCLVWALKENQPPVNHPPVAGAISAATDENKPININVLAQCSDPDNDPLTVTSVTPPSHGTATINADWTITYNPVHNYCGPDSFTYTISDGKATADAAVNQLCISIY